MVQYWCVEVVSMGWGKVKKERWIDPAMGWSGDGLVGQYRSCVSTGNNARG